MNKTNTRVGVVDTVADDDDGHVDVLGEAVVT